MLNTQEEISFRGLAGNLLSLLPYFLGIKAFNVLFVFDNDMCSKIICGRRLLKREISSFYHTFSFLQVRNLQDYILLDIHCQHWRKQISVLNLVFGICFTYFMKNFLLVKFELCIISLVPGIFNIAFLNILVLFRNLILFYFAQNKIQKISISKLLISLPTLYILVVNCVFLLNYLNCNYLIQYQ